MRWYRKGRRRPRLLKKPRLWSILSIFLSRFPLVRREVAMGYR